MDRRRNSPVESRVKIDLGQPAQSMRYASPSKATDQQQTCYLKWILILVALFVASSLTTMGILAYVLLTPTLALVNNMHAASGQVLTLTTAMDTHSPSWIQSIDDTSNQLGSLMKNVSDGTMPQQLLGINLKDVIAEVMLLVDTLGEKALDTLDSFGVNGISLVPGKKT